MNILIHIQTYMPHSLGIGWNLMMISFQYYYWPDFAHFRSWFGRHSWNSLNLKKNSRHLPFLIFNMYAWNAINTNIKIHKLKYFVRVCWVEDSYWAHSIRSTSVVQQLKKSKEKHSVGMNVQFIHLTLDLAANTTRCRQERKWCCSSCLGCLSGKNTNSSNSNKTESVSTESVSVSKGTETKSKHRTQKRRARAGGIETEWWKKSKR